MISTKLSSITFALAIALPFITPAYAQERIKLRVSSATKTLGYGPLWIASRMGFFERQGLDVDLVVIRASDVGIQALAGGSLEIAGSAADAPIAAVEKGLDLVIVGGIING
ncbi:MAG: ABC transporter substrate-binding protein, partial [Candidatus Binatia bacterium]